MTIFVAIFFGVVQGLTEFLPVSSSGHLVLINKIFGIECNFIFFSLILHLATLLAVFIVFRREIISLIKKPFSQNAVNLYIATIFTVVVVLLFKGTIESAFNGDWLPICFVITAIVLFLTEVLPQKTRRNYDFEVHKSNIVKIEKETISKKTALVMGIVQGIAVLPGISRSGSTICCGILMGETREKSTRFSFLMSIPIILASMLYEMLNAFESNIPIFDTPLLPTIFAFASAFFVGIFTIKFMLKTLQKIKLYWFSVYLLVLAVACFVF